jgi:NADPH:quinone reductase-like Zn-dependent oxidoreductase/acyl carrier protein
LLGQCDGAAAVPTYAVDLGAPSLAFLADHQVDGRPILPATAYLEIGLALAADLGIGDATLRDVRFHQTRELADDTLPIRTIGLPMADGNVLFQVRGAGEAGGVLYASGAISRSHREVGSGWVAPIEEIRARCPEEIGSEELYTVLASWGLGYRGSFRGVARLWRRTGEALGEIRLDPDARIAAFQLHPALLDACLHVAFGALRDVEFSGQANSVLVPVGVESLTLYQRPPRIVWSHVCLTPELLLGNQVGCDARLLSKTGELIAELRGLRLQRLPRPRRNDAFDGSLFEVTWVPQPLPTDPEPSYAGDWVLVAADVDGATETARLVRAVGNAIEERGGNCVVATDGSIPTERSSAPRALLFFAQPSTDDPTVSHDCRRLLALAQRSLAQPAGQPTRLGIITIGSQPPTMADSSESSQRRGLNQSLLWGFGRTLARESPHLSCTLVDIAPATLAEAAGALVRECAASPGEDQVVLRGAERLVARLGPVALAEDSPASDAFEQPVPGYKTSIKRLEITRSGSVGGVALRRTQLAPLAPGEIEIDVIAAGVNFRDVMKTLGIYPLNPGMPSWLGDECCGVVTASGADVREFAPGDAVVAIAPASFATRVRAPAHLAIRQPAGLSAEEAVTIPIAFSTAHHALVDAAGLARGETVLIHGGAGGVGLAAIQIAHHVGATVFATAGSSEKREYLRSLGVAVALDSRSLDFADEVRERTGGEGVDVVLNSLSGEALVASLDTLRPFGRFVEIGKRDIFENVKIGLRPFQRNLAFFAIDMERFFAERPDLARTLLRELAARFEAGSYQALPRTCFPIEEASRALQYLAQRKNIGKVVLSLSGTTRPDAEGQNRDVHLITGGLGGLGLEIAKWQASQSARRVVLVSRRESGPEHAEALAELRGQGVDVQTVAADVADRVAISRILDDIDARGLRLSSVFHAAGVLDDASVQSLDERRLEQVLHPKVQGAWNLHELTRDRPLDRFVLFSSVASVLGSPGQANYAAANAFLDGLSHYRRRLGLPGISINWGPWGEVGMTKRAGLNERFAELGLRSFATAEGLKLLTGIRDANPPQVVAVAADWSRLVGLSSGDRVPSLLRLLPESRGLTTARTAGTLRSEVLALLAIPEAQRRDTLIQLLREQFASVTGFPLDRFDETQPLAGYGLDSLMGLELLVRIERRLGIRLPTDRLAEDVTLSDLAADLLLRIPTSQTHSAREPATVRDPAFAER